MNDAVGVGTRLRARRAVVAVSMLAAAAGLWVAPADPAAGRPARVGGCRSGTVSLTFDDGPANGVTPQLLRILHRLQVPATFFMVGERVTAAPALARKVERAGYLIANHSYHHGLMTSQSSAQIQGDHHRHGPGAAPSACPSPAAGSTAVRRNQRNCRARDSWHWQYSGAVGHRLQ